MPVTPEAASEFDLTHFLAINRSVSPATREKEFEIKLKLLSRFRKLDGSSLVLEIGVGLGWFHVLCLRTGIPCEGVELTPQLVEMAHELAARFGVTPKIQLANIETADIGENRYDAIIAESVLEHIPDWQTVIRKVYRALKPGGIFSFNSSNKFSIFSGEFRGFPFYGWLPDRMRYWIRTKVDGPTIMLWGVDSNQFRYPMLRKVLKAAGFSEVLDYIEMKQVDSLNHPTNLRRLILAAATRSRVIKGILLTFWPTTVFMCRK